MVAEGTMTRTAIVVCAGGPARAALPDVPDDALVIAADAGILEAERLGLHVGLLIGDPASAPPDAVARAVRVERHPVDKDASDLELAVAAAVAADARRIVVVGGAGGRLGHLLGGAFPLGSAR